MSKMYDQEFKCKVCRKRYQQVSDLERHFTEKHAANDKRHKCSSCDYSSNKRSDVIRHNSSRHGEAKTRSFTTTEEKRPLTEAGSSGMRSPPKVQRLGSPPKTKNKAEGWPTLQQILGSPTEETALLATNETEANLSLTEVPPTPYVTPVRGQENGENNIQGSDFRKVVAKHPCERCTDKQTNLGFLREKIVTEVFNDGRVNVTVHKFEETSKKSSQTGERNNALT